MIKFKEKIYILTLLLFFNKILKTIKYLYNTYIKSKYVRRLLNIKE